jgi:hypothetical protein
MPTNAGNTVVATKRVNRVYRLMERCHLCLRTTPECGIRPANNRTISIVPKLNNHQPHIRTELELYSAVISNEPHVFSKIVIDVHEDNDEVCLGERKKLGMPSSALRTFSKLLIHFWRDKVRASTNSRTAPPPMPCMSSCARFSMVPKVRSLLMFMFEPPAFVPLRLAKDKDSRITQNERAHSATEVTGQGSLGKG